MKENEVKGCGKVIDKNHTCGNHTEEGIILCNECLNDAHEYRFG